MDTKISKPVKVIAISAAIIILVLVNLIVFMAPQNEQTYVYSIEDTLVKWMSGSAFPALSIYHDDPLHHPPKIVYFRNNSTFQLQNPERWQEPVYIGRRISKEVTRPKTYNDLWHVPNVSVDGNTLSYDFSAYNGAGIDCKHAVYNVTLSVFKVNVSTGKYREEYIAELPVDDLEVNNLPASESRIYRISAELIEPKPDEIYRLMFRIYCPNYFTDYNDEQKMMEDICMRCDGIRYDSSDFFLFGEDAPAIPTMIYDKR